MAARALHRTQTVSLPLTLQLIVLLLLGGGPLALAALGGGVAARWTVPTAHPVLSGLSDLPLTSSALLAELDPNVVQMARPAVPAPSAPPAAPPIAASASTPAPAAAPPPPSSQPGSTFSQGERVLVASPDADCVNLRSEPALTGQVLRCLSAGSPLRILAGPTDADGHQWWSVDAGGWIAEDYLTAAVTPAAQAASSTPITAPPVQQTVGGYAGWATYYGIEDGFVRGDIMYDGTPFDPANPTIAAASFLIPLHTWLLVCSASRCIVVQVRDRGLLDQNGILLDLSRAAYASLFGGLGGKQHITALFIDPGIVALFPSLTTAAAAP